MRMLIEFAEEIASESDAQPSKAPAIDEVRLTAKSTVELPYYVAYAYSPSERGISNGHNHIVTRADIKLGRAKRRRGDTICAPPSRRFWGLSPIGGAVTCPKCKQLAEKYRLAHRESEGA